MVCVGRPLELKGEWDLTVSFTYQWDEEEIDLYSLFFPEIRKSIQNIKKTLSYTSNTL